jgi:alanine racemase
VTFGARARIRLGAIRHNLGVIRSKAPGTRIMAVVKANAYGHGLLPIAESLSDVDSLAVARLAEAEKLRAHGISTPIVVLGGAICPDDIARAQALEVQLAVHDQQQVRWCIEYPGEIGAAWLKIDTGMNRLGIAPESAFDAIRVLQPHVRDLRVMTHFSSADNPNDPTTRRQLERFRPLIAEFHGDISLANSPGLLAWGDDIASLAASNRDRSIWVRPGLALYGISPFDGHTGSELGLEPAMEFESTLISVKPLSAGAHVGYGGSWQAPRDSVLGVVAVGYGDGYSRHIPTGAPVLVNGRRVPVIGRISMDLTTIDLGPDATDEAGDRVLLWGKALPVEEIALHASTIPYQLVTGVTHREGSVIEH